LYHIFFPTVVEREGFLFPEFAAEEFIAMPEWYFLTDARKHIVLMEHRQDCENHRQRRPKPV
jgi:hypothetical protein